ncbi:DUF1129 family protein [Metabacillus sp. 113a]|uniref:DUF1129 family protein n=1 Tax=Metabacillus sp. 113a TaxID=3404706 RepID=UPI003CF571E1
MQAKQLIKMNNEKRGLLTNENEQVYSDFLLYLRMQLSLSAQQTEEILMEILDHLLEAQKEGKKAEVLFGSDPKGYADELIALIPKDSKKSKVKFYISQLMNLLGWILAGRGLILLGAGPFLSIDPSVSLIKSGVTLSVILIFTPLLILYFFRTIQQSLFKKKNTHNLNSVKAGIAGSLLTGLLVACGLLIPETGPSFPLDWLGSLSAGIVCLILYYVIKE